MHQYFDDPIMLDLISKLLFNPAELAVDLIRDDGADDQESYEILFRREVSNPMLDYMMDR
jgi:hypothetical protein